MQRKYLTITELSLESKLNHIVKRNDIIKSLNKSIGSLIVKVE